MIYLDENERGQVCVYDKVRTITRPGTLACKLLFLEAVYVQYKRGKMNAKHV